MTMWRYLYEFFKIAKESLIINCESVAFVFYTVVFNSRAVADRQSVVPLVSDTGPNEEQTIHWRLQKLLRFLTRNFNMQPSRTERKAPFTMTSFVSFTLTSSSRFLKKPSSSMVSWLSRQRIRQCSTFPQWHTHSVQSPGQLLLSRIRKRPSSRGFSSSSACCLVILP